MPPIRMPAAPVLQHGIDRTSADPAISQPYRCTMPAKKPPVDFETSLTALETLVTKMEQGEMSLEESLQAFETGIRLTRDCQARLAAAEQRSEEHTSELQSRGHLVCRLLL